MMKMKALWRTLVLLAVCSVPRVAAAQVKPLLDNDRVRVYEATIKVGATAPQHTHPANETMYVLSGGKARITVSDGTVRVSEYKTGELNWRPAAETHAAENIGDTEIRLLTIQLKEPPANTSKTP